MKQKCEKIVKDCNQNHDIKILGFTDKLKSLMSLADIVITKGGPATILELVSQNKPMIISHYIWEQEKGNVEYVLENNYGWYEKKPKRVRQLVEKLLKNPEEIEEKRENIKKLGLKSEISESVEYLLSLDS